MTDYISRDVAVNGIAKIINESDMPEDWNKGMSAAMSALFRIPAADVRPVVRGEWEKTEDFDEYGGGRYVEWTCSVCFRKAKGGWAVRDKHIDEPPACNFCPNCGAMMEKS